MTTETAEFHYQTCCVESDAESINALCDAAEDVSYEELVANCVGVDEWAVTKGYDIDREQGLVLEDDWHVSFCKSTYQGEPCYYIQWSRIEYIWLRQAPVAGWGYGSAPRNG